MTLPQNLIDLGYEEAPFDPAEREEGRRTKMYNEHCVYLLASEEEECDAAEAAWNAGAAERAWERLRSERNEKIAKSDWMANSDVTMSDEWRAYRQALRDITSSYDDTTVQGEITWPTEPE